MPHPDGYVMTVYGAPEQLAPKLPAAEYRNLGTEERIRYWYATWDPWRFTSTREAWARFVELLSDGEWHGGQDLRAAMHHAGAKWLATLELIRHAYRAGLTEEDRLNGSAWTVDRKIRLRPNVPRRFLERPDYAQPDGCQSPPWIGREPLPSDSNSDDAPELPIPAATGRPRTAGFRRWRRRPAPARPEKRAS